MAYDILVDTDVLIWYLRGNENAKTLIHSIGDFCISGVTHIELVQGMRNKEELRRFQKTLRQWNVKTIYMNEEIPQKHFFTSKSIF